MITRRRKRRRLAIVSCKNHGKIRFRIAGYYVGGKRHRRFFDSREKAQTFLDQLEIREENLGSRAAQVDQRFHVMAIECSDRLAKYEKTLVEATDFYCAHLRAVERSCVLDEVVPRFLQSKASDGHKKRYLLELDHRLNRFQLDFKARMVNTISAMECDDWLRGLRLAPRSRNNYRRVLSVLFKYALSRGYCAENPISKTAKAKAIDKPVEVLTPKQADDLLQAATEEIGPYLAIGAFAGLRAAELMRLEWSDVHLERNFIEVSAKKSKTASRRLVTILPNLKTWLLRQSSPSGLITPPNLRKKLESVRKRAGITRWPPNGLRHSFASYHLAKFQDAAALALQLGHTTTAMLFAHYREVVTPEEAEKFWLIVPNKPEIAQVANNQAVKLEASGEVAGEVFFAKK